jgi:hypothetical protein
MHNKVYFKFISKNKMGNEGVSQLGNCLSKLKGLTNFIMAFGFDNLNN